MEPWLLEANSSPDLCEDAGPSLRCLAESALTELFQLVVALHQGAQEFPNGSDTVPECDYAANGSGRWRLCLREMTACATKDLELQRVLRSSPRSAKTRQAMSKEHLHSVKCVLGTPMVNRLHASIQRQLHASSPRGRRPE